MTSNPSLVHLTPLTTPPPSGACLQLPYGGPTLYSGSDSSRTAPVTWRNPFPRRLDNWPLTVSPFASNPGPLGSGAHLQHLFFPEKATWAPDLRACPSQWNPFPKLGYQIKDSLNFDCDAGVIARRFCISFACSGKTSG